MYRGLIKSCLIFILVLLIFSFAGFYEAKGMETLYFLPGDYFFAEVSPLEDERKKRVLYLNIQRVNEESALKMVENPDGFIRSPHKPQSLSPFTTNPTRLDHSEIKKGAE